jgi:hypothetical protein
MNIRFEFLTTPKPRTLLHRVVLAALFLVVWASAAASAQLVPIKSIVTVAGTGTQGYTGDGGPSVAAELSGPSGVAQDVAGNLYIADSQNARIRKVSQNGIITTFAGTGTSGFSGDGGAATNAQLDAPIAIALDGAGNVYISDFGNNVIRKVNASTGIITTSAGGGPANNCTTNGATPTTNSVRGVYALAISPAGDMYFNCGNVIEKLNLTGTTISIYAGQSGIQSSTGDGGAATNATFDTVEGLTVDAAGNLYIADSYANKVRFVKASTGIITTVAGTGASGFGGDGGLAISATLYGPVAVALDHSGDLFIADGGNNEIREVSGFNGKISTIAGNRTSGYAGDGGPATSATLIYPVALAYGTAGNLFVADNRTQTVRSIGYLQFVAPVGGSLGPQNLLLQTTASETLSSFTVLPSQGGKTEFSIGTVSGCKVDGSTLVPSGTVCTLPMTFSPAYPGLREVPLQAVTGAGKLNIGLTSLATGPLASLTPGIITTIAGPMNMAGDYAAHGFSGDGGPATSALLYNPTYTTTDSAGNLYFTDTGNDVVREINAATGVITTIAGTHGQSGADSGDGGPATAATFLSIGGIALDSARNLYIADYGSVRKVNAATGIISTYAGVGGLFVGNAGDGGQATAAGVDAQDSLAVDSQGNLYIPERAYNVVREVFASSGIITTVAGNGTNGYMGDGGAATSAEMSAPQAVAIDTANNLYITDNSSVVREVNAATGIITTFAGNGHTGATGDGGPATSAAVGGGYFFAVATDSAGDLYITGSGTIRKVNSATGIISTVAGKPTTGFNPYSGEGGLATSAMINPGGVAIDPAGNLYLTDDQNLRVIPATPTMLTYPTTTAVGSADTKDDPETVTLSDIGNQPLKVLNEAANNPSISAAWALDSTSTCTLVTPLGNSSSVAAGGSCTYAVDFTPKTGGANSGTLVVTDNSLNQVAATQTVALSGTGVGSAGSLSISPTSLTFGPTVQGTTSAAQTATISNTTSQAIYLSSGSLTDSNDFTQSDNCNGLIAATTGSCTVTFTFTPKSTNGLSSTYSIHDVNNPNSPLTVTLNGIATGTPGVLTVTPNPVVFPSQTVNTTSSPLTVTLKNTGNSNLSLGTTIGTVGGTDASAFALLGSMCGYTLTPGGFCTVTLTFTPNAVRTFNGTFTVATSDPNSPAVIPLSGAGVAAAAAQAALSPASANFGSQTVNTLSAAQTFTLTNAGNAALPITSVTVSSSQGFVLGNNGCVNSLAAGASCQVSITFTPGALGSATGTLSVVDSVGTQTSALSGSGIALSGADFALSATPAAQSSYLGSSVTYTLQLGSLMAANPFTGTVSLSLTGLPAGATASFSPAAVIPGPSGTTSTLTVKTPPVLSQSRVPVRPGDISRAIGIAFAGLLGPVLFGLRKRKLPRWLALCLFACLGLTALSATGCGTGTGFAIPTSTSTLVVTGISGATVHTTSVTLTLK